MASAMTLEAILTTGPVVPVIVIEEPATAVPLARALVAGGVRVLEVTLRTAAAIEAICRIRGEVESAIVGAGTVLTGRQLAAVEAAGAVFAVSPGATPALLDAAANSAMPFLPGVATASEALLLLEHGHRFLKFFPAEPAGGVAYLKALAQPLPEARFCPTGGIDAERARQYLALPNVVCIGGSWLVPTDSIRQGDWTVITELSRAAAAITAEPGHWAVE